MCRLGNRVSLSFKPSCSSNTTQSINGDDAAISFALVTMELVVGDAGGVIAVSHWLYNYWHSAVHLIYVLG